MTNDINTLVNLWAKTLGNPPSNQQFLIWTESYSSEVVRQGVLKTAIKNQTMGGGISQDHRIRFASKVMLTASVDKTEHAVNREKLKREMEGVTR